VLPSGGEYVVFVTSSDDDPNALGAYTLRLLGNAIQPLGFGSTVNASIATTDLKTSGGDYLDAYWFAGTQGESVEIRMNSNDFDSYVSLSGNSGEFLADDDNSGGNGDSLLRATLPETGLYVFFASPYAVDVTGAYSLGLERVNALSATAEAATIAPRRLSIGRIQSARGTITPSQFERFASRRVLPQP
jgi:serine protease Do